mgnify:CR=1 FL=1
MNVMFHLSLSSGLENETFSLKFGSIFLCLRYCIYYSFISDGERMAQPLVEHNFEAVQSNLI